MNWDFLKEMRHFNMDSFIGVLEIEINKVRSWGFNKLQQLKEGSECRGAIFNVDGNHFSGQVVVTVNFLDYYEVRFVKGGKIVDEKTDIFVGNLIEVIDEYVEKIPEYVR